MIYIYIYYFTYYTFYSTYCTYYYTVNYSTVITGEIKVLFLHFKTICQPELMTIHCKIILWFSRWVEIFTIKKRESLERFYSVKF